MEETRNNTNRNRTAYNYIRNNNLRKNILTPEIHLNQIWFEETDTSGIKLIELNSSTDSSEEPFVDRFSHGWSYVNNEMFRKVEEDGYRINQEARRKRRVNMDHKENNFTTAYAHQYYYDRDMQSNSNSFHDTYDSEIGNAPINHQMNCFTIINNQNAHSHSNSESSNSENYEAVEVIELDKSVEKKYWDHVYNENVVTYDPKTKENRTIWIYSYKNKRLLSDNEFELVNIPSKEISSTSTSYSISDEEQHTEKKTNPCRAASPIPATYIPRLDLSLVQTLSTVTEVSELNKSHSKDSSYETINLKPRNNWLCDRNDKYKLTENSNVVNWMALSPRERRRRSINTNSNDPEDIILDTEVTHAEGIKQKEQASIRSSEVDSSTMHVKADIHVSEKETSRELYNDPLNVSTDLKIEEVKKVTDILPMNISFGDIISDVDGNIDIDYSNKPSIQINRKLRNTEITDPIEKLNCQNWIAEEKIEKETTVYDYDLENAAVFNAEMSIPEKVNCDAEVRISENCHDAVSRRLWLKNMQLMKPPQWAEYLPLTCSPSSLHLSISVSSINSKKTWLKRLAKCVSCCK